MGGKGANLAEMTNIGLPVPAGFTITTEVCTYFYANDRTYPPELKGQVEAALANVEKIMGAKFGVATNPLLVSCRSGARDSMPGMMDTVLNIGLNEKTLEALAKQSQNERFAWDSYRRFVQMYGDVVLDLKPKDKSDIDPVRENPGRRQAQGQGRIRHRADRRPAQGARRPQFKKTVKDHTGKDFPTDPMEQIWGAIGAVFGSWMNDRAVVYRRQYGIPARMGHRRQRPGDGLRQPGRRLRHRRRPHPRRGARAARLQRRLSDQRPGRRRRRRHPHAQADRDRTAQGHARGVQAARRHRQDARKALPRRAGHRVHDPARQSLDAADPQRQADRLRRRAHRRRPGQRGADHRGGSPPETAHSGRRPESAPAADLRSRGQKGIAGQGQAAGQGHQRRSRRRHGQDLLPRLRRRSPATKETPTSS